MNVLTGEYTGRSPKDKFIVMDDVSKDTVWWTSEEYKNDNKPISEATWKELKDKAANELSHKKLYVVDAFCGANESTRLKVRFIMEVAWQAHFVTNMFIRPSKEELENFGEPDFLVLTPPVRQKWKTLRNSVCTAKPLSPSTLKKKCRSFSIPGMAAK